MLQRKVLQSALIALMILLGRVSPAQTVLTDVWKLKDQRGPVKKVMVFWSTKVSQNRLLAENEFVRQLKGRGITAMPAYVVIPPDKMVQKDAALSMIRDLGMEAVLTLRSIDKKTVQAQIPPIGPSGPSRLSDYYQNVYDAPARDDSEPAYLETNLFDAATGQRIWTARSVTKVDIVDQKALAEFISVLVDRLAADKMIP